MKKLRFDLDQLKQDSTYSYLAFNFFITAEHMTDWLYPGNANRDKREALRESSPLLQVCSHVANGAKHFKVEMKHHRSVSDTPKTGGWWPDDFWATDYWADGYWYEGELVVELDGDAARDLGASVMAVQLAGQIYVFWESKLREPGWGGA